MNVIKLKSYDPVFVFSGATREMIINLESKIDMDRMNIDCFTWKELDSYYNFLVEKYYNNL